MKAKIKNIVVEANKNNIPIELVEIGKLKPFDKNPRENDSAVDQVAESIRKFGFNQPIVCNSDYVICVGHTRYKSALKLKMKTVPVLVVPFLDDENEFIAYNIADNQTGSIAIWDDPRLAELILQLKNEDYDISVLAFDDSELAKIMENVDDNYGVDFELPDGDRIIQQMTFVLSARQIEIVQMAIDRAKNMGKFNDDDNMNSNGNALARICEVFNGKM